MADNGHGVDRRTVLRTIAASGTIVAATGLASGSPSGPRPSTMAKLERRYGDVGTVEALFESHGEGLLETLAERDYVDRSREIPVETFLSNDEYADTDAADVATVSPGRRGDTEVVDVRIRHETDDHEIEFHLHPELEDGYATVSPHDGDDAVVAYPDGTVNSLASSSCCPSTDFDGDCLGCGDTKCTNDGCDCDPDALYYYKERYCCSQDTDTCECLCSWDRYECSCPDTSTGCI